MRKRTLSICLFFFFCGFFVYAEDFDIQTRVTIPFGKKAETEHTQSSQEKGEERSIDIECRGLIGNGTLPMPLYNTFYSDSEAADRAEPIAEDENGEEYMNDSKISLRKELPQTLMQENNGYTR